MTHLLVGALIAASASATLPLQPYLREQATVTASVNGVQGTFLFDTGEGVTAISPAFAQRIGCRPWGRITGFRMTGERGGNAHCDNLTFTVSGQEMPVPSAIALDIMTLMGGNVPKIDGAIGLDAFAGKMITIVPRSCIIIESAESLARRIASATELPVRIVRDAEGVALSVDGAVTTSGGTAWMELDTGNGGSTVIANYIAPLLDIPTDVSTAKEYDFRLADGIVVATPVRTRDLILDGDISARFLNDWNLTLDLKYGRAWLSPVTHC
jgi:Aspartyl protease